MAYLARNVRLNQILCNVRAQKQLAVFIVPAAQMHGRQLIGTRDVVGFGSNGSYTYFDHPAIPYPAIRFREETPEIKKLREKEAQDWNKLSLEEKKKLYRHSFCLTISETTAPNGAWKYQLAIVMYVVSCALVFYACARKYFLPGLPETMTPEGKRHTRDLEIKYKTNPIFGLASKFDYEKGDWK